MLDDGVNTDRLAVRGGLVELAIPTAGYSRIANDAPEPVDGPWGVSLWNLYGPQPSTLTPWERVSARYRRGQLVRAIVTNVVGSDLMIQLGPRLKGWAQIGESCDESAVGSEDRVAVGDEILGRIVEIDPDQHRIDLSFKVTSKDVELSPVYEGVTITAAEPEGVLDWLRDQLTGLWVWLGRVLEFVRR